MPTGWFSSVRRVIWPSRRRPCRDWSKRGKLNVSVIGVARSAENLDELRARARASLEEHGGLDPAAFDKLSHLLRYVRGDYNDPATFHALRKELASARRPTFYLAIPPVLFTPAVEQLEKSGCAAGSRIIIEKPFGTDLVSAQFHGLWRWFSRYWYTRGAGIAFGARFRNESQLCGLRYS
jgi:Glucose-6-phosphate dehydrogenase, NAD binding domain